MSECVCLLSLWESCAFYSPKVSISHASIVVVRWHQASNINFVEDKAIQTLHQDVKDFDQEAKETFSQ